MTKGRTSKNYSPPKLVVSREEASRRIKSQIEMGREIRDQRMFSMADLESAQERRAKWLEYNIEMLTRLFDNPNFADEYNMGISFDFDSAITFGLKEQYFKEDINEQIRRLESFLEHLKLVPELTEEQLREKQLREEQFKEELLRAELPKEELLIEEPLKEEPLREKLQRVESIKVEPLKEKQPRKEPPSSIALNKSQPLGGNIFIVHGRDEALKESVLRFIEKLGLRAVILHEQPNSGRTIIEKFEDSSNVDFAIVLLTPDDIVASRDKPKERQARAPQNVIFELGYFIGKLGHKRVCVLYKEDVEIPSDYMGVLYVPMDPRDVWRLLVAKGIKQAGIEIDLNKAL